MKQWRIVFYLADNSEVHVTREYLDVPSIGFLLCAYPEIAQDWVGEVVRINVREL